ncbi:unnamed protein product [Acanthoscelides obtectus]|uniref:HTH CENPB-type domain-containing protein n=1 Tax=Acanthoscelides obtectus TaxID=200917 RepID=A0A9P0L0T6_ACAOB|nr:unnamed protein product [Acanthoscelides obtectus]CAK1677962.1 hypothetical protein AOBTE_LOCUS31680 [Acanthoscelides obtectus]
MAKTTVPTIWCNREKIKQASEYNTQRIKKTTNPVCPDVDQALIRWFEVRRTENIPISGLILKANAILGALRMDKYYQISNAPSSHKADQTDQQKVYSKTSSVAD